MKKFIIIILLFFGIGFSNSYLAQTGGKKRERRSHKKISFKRNRSAGNSDKFARNGGKKSIFKRLFKKEKKPFTANNPRTDNSRYGDSRKLFRRHHSDGRKRNADMQAKRNSERSKKRIRGNYTFKKKKY